MSDIAENGIKGMGEAAIKLIEKISDAIGVIYEPRRIVRKAQADAHVKLIQANSEYQIQEIQRLRNEEIFKRESAKIDNIQNVVAGAIPFIEEDAELALDSDWLAFFFRECEIVTDEGMQKLWGRILATEANSKSFSKQTIRIISLLTKEDAQSFTDFCSYCVMHDGKLGIPGGVDSDFFKETHLSPSAISKLSELGLVNSEVFKNAVSLENGVDINYHGTVIRLTCGKEPEFLNGILPFSGVLTTSGVELHKVCGAENHPNYIGYLLDYFRQDKNYTFEIIAQPEGLA